MARHLGVAIQLDRVAKVYAAAPERGGGVAAVADVALETSPGASSSAVAVPRCALRLEGCVLLLALLLPAEALAVPAFARRYETSCATCHQAWPRLNAVGESFRMSGYRFVDDERYRKIHPIELGDEAYKRLWPRSLWPTDIPRASPLSFVTRLMTEGDLDGSREDTVTFLLPEEIELVWVGNLGDDLAFYGDIIFLNKDFGGTEAQSWVTLKGWLQFQSLLGPDNVLNLRAGTVGTQAMGLFTARDANIYGTHFYLYSTWTMPVVDLQAAGLTDFKGNYFSIGPQAGVEVNGVGERWLYAVGVAQGDLTAPSGGPPDGAIQFFGAGEGGGSDVYAQLAYKLGGLPFERGGQEPARSLAPAAEFWRDDSTTFSLFAYRGEATIRAVFPDGRVDERVDAFWRLGAGVQAQIRDVSLSAAWVQGRNDQPYGALAPEAVDSRTWHLEALWFAYPWLLPYARYESLELDMPAALAGIAKDRDVSRVLTGAKAMIRPNVGLTLEASFYTNGAELEEGLDRTLFVLLAFAL